MESSRASIANDLLHVSRRLQAAAYGPVAVLPGSKVRHTLTGRVARVERKVALHPISDEDLSWQRLWQLTLRPTKGMLVEVAGGLLLRLFGSAEFLLPSVCLTSAVGRGT